MNIYYYDDKKEKPSSHEINLDESIYGIYSLFIINITLTSYDESKEESLKKFDIDRVALSTELRRLADEIEAIDLKEIKGK